MSLLISQGVKELVANMVNKPNEWRQESHHFQNLKRSDVNIWTANGLLFLRLGSNGATFNIIEKFYVMAGIKLSRARSVNHD